MQLDKVHHGDPPEIVLVLGGPDADGHQTFRSIMIEEPGEHADVMMTAGMWEALGKPDTLHLYAPEFTQ